MADGSAGETAACWADQTVELMAGLTAELTVVLTVAWMALHSVEPRELMWADCLDHAMELLTVLSAAGCWVHSSVVMPAAQSVERMVYRWAVSMELQSAGNWASPKAADSAAWRAVWMAGYWVQ
jgi:hypothetical protein